MLQTPKNVNRLVLFIFLLLNNTELYGHEIFPISEYYGKITIVSHSNMIEISGKSYDLHVNDINTRKKIEDLIRENNVYRVPLCVYVNFLGHISDGKRGGRSIATITKLNYIRQIECE